MVDDDPVIVRILQHHLTKWGYEVHCAASFDELQDVLARNTIDLVLLDLHLADEQGLDVLSDLVRERFAGPIIILTGHASIETAVRAIKLGAYDFIAKPPDLQQLHAVLQFALQQHSVKAGCRERTGERLRAQEQSAGRREPQNAAIAANDRRAGARQRQRLH